MKDDDLKKEAERNMQEIANLKKAAQEMNEVQLRIRESMKERKGLSDDLSALSNHGYKNSEESETDLNNNKKVHEEILPKEIPSVPVELEVPFVLPGKINSSDTTDEHGTKHQFDVGCKICTGKQAPPQVSSSPKETETKKVSVSEKKRKHDSDFESDSDEEETSKPTISKASVVKKVLPKPVEQEIPCIPTTSPSISLENRFIFDQLFWSGLMNITFKEKHGLNAKAYCINDQAASNYPLINRFLNDIKSRINKHNIKALEFRKLVMIKSIWAEYIASQKNYVILRLEPNMAEKSFLHKTIPLPTESDAIFQLVNAELFAKNNKQYYIQMEIPEELKDLLQDFILIPLKKKDSSHTEDVNLREKYSIRITRNQDYLLALLLPHQPNKPVEPVQPQAEPQIIPIETNKRKSEDIQKDAENSKKAKLSDESAKATPRPTLVRDPRIRSKPTMSTQVSQEDTSNSNIPDLNQVFSNNLEIFLKGILESVKQTTNVPPIDTNLTNEILSNINQSSELATKSVTDNSNKILSLDLYKLKKKKALINPQMNRQLK